MNNNTNMRPYSIALDITYDCTLRCLHCFNSSGEHKQGRKELSDKEILDICDDIITLQPKSVCICGGEPLLRKELLYKVVKKITEGSKNETNVNVVSNGELLTKDVAKNLKESGIGNVQISLDGSSQESHDWIRNKKGSFERAINALRYLNEVGIETSVSCLPSIKNIDEIRDTIFLCKSLGVSNFRMQPLMLLGRAKQNLNDYVLDYNRYAEISNIIEEVRLNSYYDDMYIEWGDPTEHLMDEIQENLKKNPMITINGYGDLIISPYVPLSVGNIRKHSLLEYWNAGFAKCLDIKFVKELNSKFSTAEAMDLNEIDNRIPKIYTENPIYFDIIENKNYEEVTLENLFDLMKEEE